MAVHTTVSYDYARDYFFSFPTNPINIWKLNKHTVPTGLLSWKLLTKNTISSMHCIDKVKCWIRKYGWKKMIVKQFSVWIKLNYLVCFRAVECAAVLLNRNQNHRRNNFLRCGTGTRTVTCQKGTGTIINLLFRNRNKMVTLKFSQHTQFKIVYLISFI